MAKLEEREKIYDLVAGLLAKGYDQPYQIARNLNANGMKCSRKTASRYLAIVKARAVANDSAEDRATWRAMALAQVRTALRMAQETHAAAQQCENHNAQVGALSIFVKANERFTKILGLDVAETNLTVADMEAEAAEALGKLPAFNDEE